MVVPAGKAWLTERVSAFPDGTIATRRCDEDVTGYLGTYTRRFTVSDVFLDKLEVTNGCYAACVADDTCGVPAPITNLNGDELPPWDDPSRGAYPVLVTAEDAEVFCSWRGGRLPTELELTRADHGDVLHVGNKTVYEATVACAIATEESADCELLLDHGLLWGEPSHNVGSVADDRGPFGHVDLFGSICEATSSVLAARPPDALGSAVCQLAEDSEDPGTWGDDWKLRAYFCPARGPAWGAPLLEGGVNSVYSDPENAVPAIKGFRCAYDPIYISE